MTALDTPTVDETAPATTGDTLSDARQNLIDYGSLGGFTLSAETHAWYAAVDTVGSPEEARAASTVLAELRGRDLPATRAAAERLSQETTLGELDSVVAVGRALALTLRVRSTLQVLVPTAYESEHLTAFAAATASGRWRKEQGQKLTLGQRLNLTRAARGLALAKRVRRTTLHAALVAAVAERTDWVALSSTGSRPVLPADLDFLDGAAQSVDDALAALAELGRLGVDGNLSALSLDALTELVDRLASDEGTLHRLPALRALRAALEEQGHGALVAELTAARADAEAVAAAVTREFGAVDAVDAVAEEQPAQALVPAPREEELTVTETTTPEPEEVAPVVEAEMVEAEAAPVVEAPVVEAPAVKAPVRAKAKPRAKAVKAAAPAEAPAAPAEAPVEEAPRPAKPVFTPGRPVAAYSAEELASVVAWIDSDGEKRTDDQLLRAAMKELGFARLGPRIKEALDAAIATARG